ncbi:hypothetical protein IKF81_02920 [Candidatus Saccharibacteria bacterium]|nr:hypothetical protein [Candidatus Saccharibacteria bacterium]
MEKSGNFSGNRGGELNPEKIWLDEDWAYERRRKIRAEQRRAQLGREEAQQSGKHTLEVSRREAAEKRSNTGNVESFDRAEEILKFVSPSATGYEVTKSSDVFDGRNNSERKREERDLVDSEEIEEMMKEVVDEAEAKAGRERFDREKIKSEIKEKLNKIPTFKQKVRKAWKRALLGALSAAALFGATPRTIGAGQSRETTTVSTESNKEYSRFDYTEDAKAHEDEDSEETDSTNYSRFDSMAEGKDKYTRFDSMSDAALHAKSAEKSGAEEQAENKDFRGNYNYYGIRDKAYSMEGLYGHFDQKPNDVAFSAGIDNVKGVVGKELGKDAEDVTDAESTMYIARQNEVAAAYLFELPDSLKPEALKGKTQAEVESILESVAPGTYNKYLAGLKSILTSKTTKVERDVLSGKFENVLLSGPKEGFSTENVRLVGTTTNETNMEVVRYSFYDNYGTKLGEMLVKVACGQPVRQIAEAASPTYDSLEWIPAPVDVVPEVMPEVEETESTKPDETSEKPEETPDKPEEMPDKPEEEPEEIPEEELDETPDENLFEEESEELEEEPEEEFGEDSEGPELFEIPEEELEEEPEEGPEEMPEEEYEEEPEEIPEEKPEEMPEEEPEEEPEEKPEDKPEIPEEKPEEPEETPEIPEEKPEEPEEIPEKPQPEPEKPQPKDPENQQRIVNQAEEQGLAGEVTQTEDATKFEEVTPEPERQPYFPPEASAIIEDSGTETSGEETQQQAETQAEQPVISNDQNQFTMPEDVWRDNNDTGTPITSGGEVADYQQQQANEAEHQEPLTQEEGDALIDELINGLGL